MRVLHYVNQFFGGLGGEDHANEAPRLVEGAVGPGRALAAALGKRGTIVATVICGDNYAVEEDARLKGFFLEAIRKHKPDVVVAGPAFDAGRYGIACGLVCKFAQEAGLPGISAMHPDNTGVTTHRRDMIALPTSAAVADMPKVLAKLADLAARVGTGQKLGSAAQEGYIPRGLRMDVSRAEPGSRRAVAMLLDQVHGRPFQSEIVIRDYDAAPPLPAMKTLRGVKVGIVTSGGLVPKGNPDKVPAARAEEFEKYNIGGMAELKVGDWEAIHGGYGHRSVNEIDPNYVVPLRSLRLLEKSGEIGSIHPEYFATVGNQTAVNAARKMGKEIAAEFKAAGVGAVILVPT